MGMSEVERRVSDLNALLKAQQRLIIKLEKRGKDLTSAKIVFDSLRVSLFLATQEWHRIQRLGEPDQISADNKPNLVVVPTGKPQGDGTRWNGGEPLVKSPDDLVNLVGKVGAKDALISEDGAS